MTSYISFNSIIFILILIIILVIAIYIFFIYQKDIDNLKNKLNECLNTCHKKDPIKTTLHNNLENPVYPNNTPISLHQTEHIPTPLINNPNIIKPIEIYDNSNLEDPLVYPTARQSEHIFKSLINNPLFFNHTKGLPDKPHYIANLVEINSEDENNKSYNPQLPTVLQLIGQQKYPNSFKFNYYVLLPSTGNNPPIKYVIDTHHNEELYDDDIVKILGKSYMVKKNKSPI